MENGKLNIDNDLKNIDTGKVIKLSLPSLVKDEDITSLFIGLIKLIKRNSAYECERKYKSSIDALRREINLLKLENKLLKEGEGKEI